MKKELITLQVCVKRENNVAATRVFISSSDLNRTNEFGYPIVVAKDKEYFVPTSSTLYEHHYEVKSFSFPENAYVKVVNTPFVKNAPSKQTHIKVK